VTKWSPVKVLDLPEIPGETNESGKKHEDTKGTEGSPWKTPHHRPNSVWRQLLWKTEQNCEEFKENNRNTNPIDKQNLDACPILWETTARLGTLCALRVFVLNSLGRPASPLLRLCRLRKSADHSAPRSWRTCTRQSAFGRGAILLQRPPCQRQPGQTLDQEKQRAQLKNALENQLPSPVDAHVARVQRAGSVGVCHGDSESSSQVIALGEYPPALRWRKGSQDALACAAAH